MFFGMVIYVNLGLASGYLEKTLGEDVRSRSGDGAGSGCGNGGSSDGGL